MPDPVTLYDVLSDVLLLKDASKLTSPHVADSIGGDFATLDSSVLTDHPGAYAQLIWAPRPLTDDEVRVAGGLPYVRVVELPEAYGKYLYRGVDIAHRMVDVEITQAPDSKGSAPDYVAATALYYVLLEAIPRLVTTHTYGDDSLIDVHRLYSQAPRYDERSSGVFGMMRLNLLLARR
jgi:hypothetical protein